MSTDLTLVSTHELVDELLRRVDHGVITTVKILTEQQMVVTRRWVGNSHTVVGLAADAQRCILDAHHEDVQDLDDEERKDIS